MGLFSRPIVLVADTRIFVTDLSEGRQMLVYETRLWANDDVRVFLPLPVAEGTRVGDVRFVTVPNQGSFFADLASGFGSATPSRSGAEGQSARLGRLSTTYLEGALAMSTLAPKTRLHEGVLKHVPGSARAGLAVMDLKKCDGVRYQAAIDFPRSDPKTLFFPLTQVHDERYRATVAVDHTLYCQQNGPEPTRHVDGWKMSEEPAGRFVGAKRKGVVDPSRHVYMKPLRGQRENRDLYVASKTLSLARSPGRR